MSFDAPLGDFLRGLPSTFQDDRPIGSLPCTTFIREVDELEIGDTITFVPAFSADDLDIREPDCLQMDIYLASANFAELWHAVQDKATIVLGATIQDLPPKYRYDSLSPYVWDVSAEGARTKPIKEFWFSVLTRTACDAEARLAGERAEGDEDNLKSQALATGKQICERYADKTQMRRLCLQAIDQAEREAKRRGLSSWASSDLISGAVELVEAAHAYVRRYDFEEPR